jgi:uncharacterized damage-inducible protein DinB
MTRVALALVALLAGAGPALGQSSTAPTSAAATSKMLWEQLSGWFTTAAAETPESLYAFRPTSEVRSFGQLVGHVAGAQYLICGAAMGEQPKKEDDIEKTKTAKADLVAALKASNEYCAKAYSQSDKDAQGQTKLFGETRTRLFALTLNATHDGEHYGNMVVYLRLNRIVPPSSRQP